jgi:hypothetical protein
MDADGDEIDLQMGVPHRAFGRANILRVTIPYLMSTPVGSPGLTDVAVFDVILYPNDWGTLAVGAVTTFAPYKGNDTDMFAIGPAIGAVLKSSAWTYGVFSQNLFSFKNEIGPRRWKSDRRNGAHRSLGAPQPARRGRQTAHAGSTRFAAAGGWPRARRLHEGPMSFRRTATEYPMSP